MSFGGGGRSLPPRSPLPKVADVLMNEASTQGESRRRKGSATLISDRLGRTEDPRIIFPQLSSVLGGGR